MADAQIYIAAIGMALLIDLLDATAILAKDDAVSARFSWPADVPIRIFVLVAFLRASAAFLVAVIGHWAEVVCSAAGGAAVGAGTVATVEMYFGAVLRRHDAREAA